MPASTMATAEQIHVRASDTGLLKFDQSDDTAQKVSELLQKDLEKHHVFFNAEGFHNHIPHHLLALFGTGAGPSALQQAFNVNDSYQLPAQKTHPGIADKLAADWVGTAPSYLGRGSHYPDFLLFFQRELEKAPNPRPHEHVVAEFLFKGDARAEDLLQRMYAGFLHPLIQLMYGLEWSQPAIVAEALAQAAVHKNQLNSFFEESDKLAAESATTPMPPLVEFFEGISRDEKLRSATRASDPNKIFDGVMKRAPEEMMAFAKRVKVLPEELDERTAEMFESAIWVGAGAALRPGKGAKWDFFLIHHINASPIFVTLNKQPWISQANKIRILEWKIRLDLVQYAARGTAPLRFSSVADYKPKDLDRPDGTLVQNAADLLPRFHVIPDDGHTIKLVRALEICRNLSAAYADKPWRQVRDDETWLKLHYMVLDGAELADGEGERWIRSAGLDELWERFPDRDWKL